jgi:hypothetical protein
VPQYYYVATVIHIQSVCSQMCVCVCVCVCMYTRTLNLHNIQMLVGQKCRQR